MSISDTRDDLDHDAVRIEALPWDIALDILTKSGSGPLQTAAPALRARFRRGFRLISPFAPGLFCLGGELGLAGAERDANGAETLSVTGNGRTMSEAVPGLFGEAADLLSQFEQPGDIVGNPAPLSGWIAAWAGLHHLAEATLDGYPAIRVPARDKVIIPADVALRRSPERRLTTLPFALSSGCAAGPTRGDAELRAILELIERDAAALWWYGGLPARPVDPCGEIGQAGSLCLKGFRKDVTSRDTRLFDITTDLGIPVFAAVSSNGTESPRLGHDMAFGFAARLDAAAAMEAAISELCQMELAIPIARQKLTERGEKALNDADRRHLHRAAFRLQDCPWLQRGRNDDAIKSEPPPVPSSTGLARHLATNGIECLIAELTRSSFRVPVVRAIAPALQPFTDEIVTSRLRQSLSAGNLTVPRRRGFTPM
ncbi:MAG: YcaO-like family protein [Xanthobacteraceae bacterium]|nr:YcaO-like family protein [Xanthobacteraceae bacterium]